MQWKTKALAVSSSVRLCGFWHYCCHAAAAHYKAARLTIKSMAADVKRDCPGKKVEVKEDSVSRYPSKEAPVGPDSGAIVEACRSILSLSLSLSLSLIFLSKVCLGTLLSISLHIDKDL